MAGALLEFGAGLLSTRALGGRSQAGKQEDEDRPGILGAPVRAPASVIIGSVLVPAQTWCSLPLNKSFLCP